MLQEHKRDLARLVRVLALLSRATLFGVGLILGAGIYVLVGRAAVGGAVWMSVAFPALIAVAAVFSCGALLDIL